MLAVQVAVDIGRGGVDVTEAEAALLELEPVNVLWLAQHWSGYTGKSVPARSVALALRTLPGTEPVQVDLQIDDTLFHQLALLYALWGWPVVEAVQAQIAALSPPQPSLGGLVRGASGLLRARIIEELAAIEAEVSILAKSRWQATRRQLANWSGGFRKITKSQYVFADRQAWKQTNARLEVFHALARKRKRSEDERKNTPGLGRGYVPGVNDDEYRYKDIARNWGAREKEYLRGGAEQLALLRVECPAAVLVADTSADLFEPSGGKPSTPGMKQGAHLIYSDRESALATLIRDTLLRNDSQLAQLTDSLVMDGVAEQAARRGGLVPVLGEYWNRDDPGAERIVARRCLERWTLGASLQRTLISPVPLAEALLACAIEPESNTVLGMADLVRAYALDRNAKGRSRFRTCVAVHYQHALEAEIEAARREADKFRILVTVLNWIAAVAALVAFVASTVVSGGASLPAGAVLVCTLIEGVDAALGMAMLALSVVDVIGQVQTAQDEWRQAIALMSVESVETLRRAGLMLGSCSALGIEITTQLVASVLKLKVAGRIDEALALRLGLPDKIAVVRRALELEWLAGDIGTTVEDGVLVLALAQDTAR